jgi:hypothetical protein
MAAMFSQAEHIELTLGAVLKGCLPAPPAPEGRQIQLALRVLLQPRARPPREAVPPGVQGAAGDDDDNEAEQEAAAAAGGKAATAPKAPKKA